MIRIIDFNRAEPTCYRTNFPYASFGWQNGAFWYIVLRVMLLTYTRAMIRLSNCGGLSRMVNWKTRVTELGHAGRDGQLYLHACRDRYFDFLLAISLLRKRKLVAILCVVAVCVLCHVLVCSLWLWHSWSCSITFWSFSRWPFTWSAW